jgi:multidrug resistance efflux pump
MQNIQLHGRLSSLAKHWLQCFASSTPGILQAQFFLNVPEKKDHQLLSVWPENTPVDQEISQVVNLCIKKQQPVFLNKVAPLNKTVNVNKQAQVLSVGPMQSYLLAIPVMVGDQAYGALGVLIRAKARDNCEQLLLAPLIQAVKWLVLFSSAECAEEGDRDATGIVLQVAQASLLHDNLREAATVVAIELATLLHCEMVAIGLIEEQAQKHHHIMIVGLSSSPNFSSKQSLVQALSTLIEEAIDQDRSILEPPKQKSDRSSQLIHRKYSRQQGNAHLCTVPLVFNHKMMGGMVFERPHGAAEFSQQEALLIQQIAALVSPIFIYRTRSQLSLAQQSVNLLRKYTLKTLGKGHLVWKISAAFCTLLIVFFSLATSDYRITATAVLESKIERIISAPEDGFIKAVHVRPGDKVEAEQLLVSLDDRDLQLEKQRWKSKLQQTAKEYREALAGQETWRIGLLRAQRDQEQSQLDLTNSKLSRSSIVSPLAGMVASGDLNQSLGSPIQQGDQLFTIAPLDDYRVHLKVDESDIAYLQPGQQGTLNLRAAVGQSLHFTVEKITPVAVNENSINYFRVDALLELQPDYLRPGMQGISKIAVGEYRLIWIWTRRLIEWLQLTIWTWW